MSFRRLCDANQERTKDWMQNQDETFQDNYAGDRHTCEFVEERLRVDWDEGHSA